MNKESFPNQEGLGTNDQEASPDAETVNEEIDIKVRIKDMISKFGREKVEQAIKEYEGEEQGETVPIEELIEQDIKETGVSELTAEEAEKERQDKEHLITPEKLKPIITEIQNSDQNAKEELLSLFEKYIPSVMHDYFDELQPEDQEDLLQEGRIGLLAAAEKCDLDRVDTFKAYAREYIWSYMHRFYSKDQLIQVKEGMKQKIRDLNELENQAALAGEKPAEHETARQLGIGEQELKKIKESRNLLGIISLDDLHFARHRFGDQEDETNEPWLAVKDKIASNEPEGQPQEEVFEKIFYEKIGDLLQYLTPKQLFVVDKRFGESWPLERVARDLNTTRDQVRRIELNALGKLRSLASRKVQGLETFLEK